MKSSTPSDFADSLNKLLEINKTVPLYQFYSIQIVHGRIILQGDYNSKIRMECQLAFEKSFYLMDENCVQLDNEELNLFIFLRLPI